MTPFLFWKIEFTASETSLAGVLQIVGAQPFGMGGWGLLTHPNEFTFRFLCK